MSDLEFYSIPLLFYSKKARSKIPADLKINCTIFSDHYTKLLLPLNAPLI